MKAVFKDALKSALKRNYWKLKVLYDTIAELYPREIKVQLPYNESLTSLKRWRRSIYPSNPTNVQEMATQLESPENGRLMDYGVGTLLSRQIIDSAGKAHVLLYDPEFVEDAFRTVTQIFIDGTFQTTPSVRGVYQLLTILGVTYNHMMCKKWQGIMQRMSKRSPPTTSRVSEGMLSTTTDSYCQRRNLAYKV